MERKKLEAVVGELKGMEVVRQDSFFFDALNNIEAATAKKAFKIAVVGEFSTGKSTFINAVIGKDLLSHATQEVTATITNIHNVGRRDRRYRTCDVTFYDGTVTHLGDDRELVQYTTTQSHQHNVVQDIRYVDYYTDFMAEDTDVVIVDTPGLNGMADGHRELTLEEVKQANYCIYLFGIRGMADTDKTIIRQLSSYQNKFIFVLNFVDQLKGSEGESVQEILDGIRDFLDEDVFSGQKDKEYEIFGVSSLKALAGKDGGIQRLYQNDTRDIREDERKLLYRESGFQRFESYLSKAINSSTIEKLRLEQMKYLLEHFLEDVWKYLTQSQEQMEFLRSEAGKAEGVEKLKRKLEYLEETSDKNKEKVVNYAVSECRNIRQEFSQYLKESLEKMKRENLEGLQRFKRYEDLEMFVKNGELNGKIKAQSDAIYDYVEKNIGICLNGVLNNILMRIQEYMKDTRMSKGTDKIEFTIGKIQSRQEASIRSIESGIADARRKQTEAERKMTAAETEIRSGERERSDAESSAMRNENMLNTAERQKQDRIRRLGAQPEVEKSYYYTTEYYTAYEYRSGLWGKIANWFAGPKEVTKSRQIKHETLDDTKRKAWVKQRDRIISESNREIEQYRSRMDADQNRLRSLESRLRRQKDNKEAAEAECRYYKDKLAKDKALLEDLKRKANAELLEALKKNVKQQLEIYCDDRDGEVAVVVREYIDEVIEKNKKLIIEKTKQFYDQRFEDTRRMYESEIEGRRESAAARYGDYSQQLVKIEQMRKELKHVG